MKRFFCEPALVIMASPVATLVSKFFFYGIKYLAELTCLIF